MIINKELSHKKTHPLYPTLQPRHDRFNAECFMRRTDSTKALTGKVPSSSH